jgi:hypothetical protein
MSSDAPITRVTALEFQPDSNVKYNGLYPPHLTLQERDAIEKIPSNIAGIIYNTQTQDLEYLAPTYNWIAVATAGGDFSFEDLTVTHDLSVGHNLNVTGLSTLVNLTLTNSLTVAQNAFIGNTIYGARCSGGLYNTNTPSFAVTANTPIKIPGTTLASVQNAFTATNNRLAFGAPIPSITAIIGAVSGEFTFNFSTNALITLGIAVNGSLQNPVSKQTTASTGTYTLNVNTQLALANTDYIELWVVADQNGTFSTGGTMKLYISQT